MAHTFLSIIIPSFNQGNYIENAILSVLKQEFQDWELIIQDGNSTDQTASICRRYATLDSRIQFFSEPDKGFADAATKAITKCVGTLVGIQSSDDFYATKDVFAEVAQFHRQYPSLQMIGGYATMVDSRCMQILAPYNPQENGFLRPDTVYTLRNHFSQGAMFFSKERAIHVNGFDETVDMVADTDFWVRMANYRPVSLNKIFRTTHVWGCVTIHENQRSNHYSHFFLGRAKMAAKHLKDSRIALEEKLKHDHALNLIQAAYYHFHSIGAATEEIQELFRDVTGKAMRLKKESSGILAKFPLFRKTRPKNGKAIETSLDYLEIYPTGADLKWF